jgi:DNA-binding NarL/FixJ family response regulator
MTDGTGVFVASSDRLFADAARDFFERTGGWRCTGVAFDGIAALAALARVQTDALLVTEAVGRLGAVALSTQARRRHPGLTIVVVGRAPNPAARVLDPSAAPQDVLDALRAPAAEPAAASREERTRELALLAALTKRERIVLKVIANGASLAEAADELGVSAHTVRTHVQNLYDKIDCHSRLDLVRFAQRHGLIAGSPEAG